MDAFKDPIVGGKNLVVGGFNRGVNAVISIPGKTIDGIINFTGRSIWNVLVGGAKLIGGVALRTPVIGIPK